MGVKLGALVDFEETSLEELNGKKLAVDAFNTIYQFLSMIRQRDGTPLMDSKGRITSHLSGIFYRNVNLLEKGIQPIYVFDGEPPDFKKVREERKKRKKKAREKYEKALEQGDMVSARKYAQQTSRLTKEMVEESKKLLGLMGIPFVQAPSEGEAQAAHMCRKKHVWAVASQDYDSLLFGAPKMVRNINITGRRKAPGRNYYTSINPEIVELKKVLEKLGIDRKRLIILGILVGTDYNPGGIRGIGPKRGLDLVQSKKTFEQIMDEVDWGFDIKPNEILEWFMQPKVTDSYDISRKPPQKQELREFLCNGHDFSEKRINSGLSKLEEPPQSNLQNYF